MRKILFLHGFFASGQCVPAMALRDAFKGRAEVITPDLPMHPKEAISHIRELIDKEEPDLLVGNSCGAFYAQMVASETGVPALLGNPHFKMTEFLRERIGKHQYKSPRKDGNQDFTIDEALIDEFTEVEATQFESCNPLYKDRIWGLFGGQDTLAHFEPLFLKYYEKSFHFPGGHTPTAEEVRVWYVPLAEKMLGMKSTELNDIKMEVQQFIQDFREAFGQKVALPLLFGYGNQPVAETERILGCFFKGLQAAREGVNVSLSAEVIACGGGKLYTGFTDMPERVPRFVSLTEKYKKTPQMVVDYVEGLGMKRAEKAYLNFVRIDKAESFDGFEGIMFYATPDMLSGLCGWAFFDTNAEDAVVSKFSSGCSTVVSMTIQENAHQGQRCFLGLFDPSVRPYVGADELSFTIPMSRFRVMTETMRECFLFDSHAWKKVKARLEE